eukprot:TRINITY_DN54069_c0_g1_i1.p1 TRINITY_DN54069_c0_g1~~TRINITY_DN54069_c0_g1_i1.p1  ORF type:complete len:327 (-),score=51.57 TRINITY_DN54069_c0_g1_i1:482-1462(-)
MANYERTSYPGYVLVRRLGKGAQAKVYKARVDDNRGQRGDAEEFVAMKIFHTERVFATARMELDILAAVQGHQNILRLIDSIDLQGLPHAFVVELCTTDLEKKVAERPLTENAAVDITRGILSALKHVHTLGIMHRDVKPENVALAADGEARLIDFGIATHVADVDRSCIAVGSLGYAAPEVLSKKAYGLSVDVFGLGATLYYALSQEHPFETSSNSNESIIAKTKKGVVSFGQKFEHITSDTVDMIRWLTHCHASWRPRASIALLTSPFTSSAEVKQEQLQVRAFSAGPTPSRPIAPRPPSAAKPVHARPAPHRRARQLASPGSV